MSDAGTIFGNSLFVIASFFGVMYFLLWMRTGRLHPDNHAVGIAWVIKDTAVMVRVGYWILALILAPENCLTVATESCSYHPSFLEHKHWITVPTSLAYVYGQLMFIKSVEAFSFLEKSYLFIAALFIALAVTMLGY